MRGSRIFFQEGRFEGYPSLPGGMGVQDRFFYNFSFNLRIDPRMHI